MHILKRIALFHYGNTDYKILISILTERLNQIISNDDDKTGFIRDRYLKDNIRKVINIIDKAQNEVSPLAFLFLDAEKAFNRIEWQYLKYVVNRFGLGPCLGKLIDIIIQQEQIAMVVIEGQLSNAVVPKLVSF